MDEKTKFASVKMRVREIRREEELSDTLDGGKRLTAGRHLFPTNRARFCIALSDGG